MDEKCRLMVQVMQLSTNGFTMIEMLFSLLIISMLMIFITFNLIGEVTASNLKSATLTIQSVLEGARSCAIATKQTSSVVFNENSLEVNCGTADYVSRLNRVTVSTNFPNSTATFTKSGIVNQAATIEVCSKSKCTDITIGIGRSDVQIK